MCATDLEHLYTIYPIPTHDQHQWLLLEFIVFLMMDAKGVRNMQSILLDVNKLSTARVASCWFIIYYRLVMRGNSNIKLPATLHTDQQRFCLHLPQFFLECEMFQRKLVEKIKTHIFLSVTFFPRKQCSLWDDVEKYYRARQATDENTAQVHYVLDTTGHKHARRICNTCCFSTVTMVARTRLNVPLYVHCLSCLKLLTDFKSSRCNGAMTRYVLRCVDISQLCFFQMLTPPQTHIHLSS